MNPKLSVARSATALLAANLGLGLLPFVLIAGIQPAIRWHGALPLGICLTVALVTAFFVAPNPSQLLKPGPTPKRRLLACLLLGASLAGIPWKQQGFPLSSIVIGTGFGIRWLLFGLETLNLRHADQSRNPLPCAATHIRRACTLITGVLIPLMLAAGFPVIPLLWISFLLTLFCQWTVGGEACHELSTSRKPAIHLYPSSNHPNAMNNAHSADGGIF